ncbi:histidine kinase [Rheinheimera sp. SA_1]|uniref:GGDEF domain-containing protein n=1 Tax=Rheinheimera sp. SA_1 TaxID=1827365 RepID=UPI0007FED9B5|nr:GGDEF domain-containing protein [Rheinheimera sp. SA_1]OBP16225.1 histidine kinase [Rheinheimera sp. SA_1]
MDIIKEIFNGNFMPHGHCLLWRGDLLFLHVGGDLLTFTAYTLIPIALVKLVKSRDDFRFNWLFLMFAGFIFFCGATHLVGLINIWNGYYYIEGIVKFLTGIISMVTAVMLWHLLPEAISFPSRRNMQQKITELQQAEKQLAESNLRLEAEVKKRTAQLEKIATTDELTGLYNRREIMRILDIEISRVFRQQTPLSIMMLDLDHFKAINDQYGHQTGDVTLQNAAASISQGIRKTDSIGRIGGEEFLIIMPDTTIESAYDHADRIRQTLAMQKAKDTAEQGCTASIGVAQFLQDDSLKSFIQRADETLYRAKAEGRNRVCRSLSE